MPWDARIRGPHVDRMASEAEQVVPLPRVWLEAGSYDFSLSGLKSAVLNALNQAKMRGETLEPSAVARGFQEAVVEVLVEKAVRAVREYGSRQLLLCGGVAANRGLRSALQERCAKEGLELLIPPMEYCTDNAAMIGAAAYLKWQRVKSRNLMPRQIRDYPWRHGLFSLCSQCWNLRVDSSM